MLGCFFIYFIFRNKRKLNKYPASGKADAAKMPIFNPKTSGEKEKSEVSFEEEITALKETTYGAILGKAIYDGLLDLEKALELAE